MVIVEITERKKRGCIFCADVVGSGQTYSCPYEECPYKSLDPFANYDQYLEAEGIAFSPGVVLQYIHGKV